MMSIFYKLPSVLSAMAAALTALSWQTACMSVGAQTYNTVSSPSALYPGGEAVDDGDNAQADPGGASDTTLAPQANPALNVVAPAARPPIPAPPPVSLPPVPQGSYKTPQSWRLKATSLYKTAPDKSKIYQGFYAGDQELTMRNLMQAAQDQGLYVADYNNRSGHILLTNEPDSTASGGNIESGGAGEIRRQPEKLVIALRASQTGPKVTDVTTEIRACAESRNRVLTLDRARQLLDQLPRAQGQSGEVL